MPDKQTDGQTDGRTSWHKWDVVMDKDKWRDEVANMSDFCSVSSGKFYCVYLFICLE